MFIPVHKRFYVIGSKPWKCKPNSTATATATAWSSSPGHLALMMCLSVCVKSLSTGWTCTAREEKVARRPAAPATSDLYHAVHKPPSIFSRGMQLLQH